METDNRFITYKLTIGLLILGIAPKNPIRFFTKNHPTLIDGVLMRERIAPNYACSESELSNYYIPTVTWDEAFELLEKRFGIYVEWLIDMWGSDSSISTPIYRCYIWTVGKPKPSLSEDLGSGERGKMREVALNSIIHNLISK